MKDSQRIKKLKKSFIELDCIVPTIDKIGSGFEDTERTALALLLYFKEQKVLDRLAKISTTISNELEKKLTYAQFDELIEQDKDMWKPPYAASKEELLDMLNNS